MKVETWTELPALTVEWAFRAPGDFPIERWRADRRRLSSGGIVKFHAQNGKKLARRRPAKVGSKDSIGGDHGAR